MPALLNVKESYKTTFFWDINAARYLIQACYMNEMMYYTTNPANPDETFINLDDNFKLFL